VAVATPASPTTVPLLLTLCDGGYIPTRRNVRIRRTKARVVVRNVDREVSAYGHGDRTAVGSKLHHGIAIAGGVARIHRLSWATHSPSLTPKTQMQKSPASAACYFCQPQSPAVPGLNLCTPPTLTLGNKSLRGESEHLCISVRRQCNGERGTDRRGQVE